MRLTPTEYSSGESTSRGSITKAGPEPVRTQLVESAWAYQHRPAVGATIHNRQAGCPPATVARAWKAQQRLGRRFRALSARKNGKRKVVVAVARELAGFVWAEMVADDHYNPDPPTPDATSWAARRCVPTCTAGRCAAAAGPDPRTTYAPQTIRSARANLVRGTFLRTTTCGPDREHQNGG